MKRAALVLVIILVLTAAVFAYAQLRPLGQNGQPGGPGNMFPPFPPPTAMLVSDGFLYIERGDMLFKVSCSDLKVVAVGGLPRPEPPQPPPSD